MPPSPQRNRRPPKPTLGMRWSKVGLSKVFRKARSQVEWWFSNPTLEVDWRLIVCCLSGIQGGIQGGLTQRRFVESCWRIVSIELELNPKFCRDFQDIEQGTNIGTWSSCSWHGWVYASTILNFAELGWSKLAVAVVGLWWLPVLRFTHHSMFPMNTLPETNSLHPKMDGWKTTFFLGWPIFRGYVSFREGRSTSRFVELFWV